METNEQLKTMIVTIILVVSVIVAGLAASRSEVQDEKISLTLEVNTTSKEEYRVDIPDGQIAENTTGEGYPFPEEYPTVQQLNDWYDDIIDEHPEITKKINIGESYEGRDMWVIKVSDDVEEEQDEPSIFIHGNLHAREWSTNQASAYFLWRLVEDYGSNETITWLVDNRQIYVAPMTNPDGYIYDGEGDLSQAQGWRKNRNDSTPTEYVGVDLNRNWATDWENGNDDPWADTYHGEAPFSEYETQNLRDFILEKEIDSYQDMHSHFGTILIPWCYTSGPSPHDGWYRDMADDMTSMTSLLGDDSQQYSYGQPSEEIGYSASGGSIDWVYDETGAVSLCYELYTPDSGMAGFYPDEEYIMPINLDVYDSLVYQARVADIDLGDGTEHLYPPSPYIVYGTVEDEYGSPVTDTEVEIENLATGETISIQTDHNGYYELNFGTLVEDGYSSDDTFEIRAVFHSEQFTIDDEWGQRRDMVLEIEGDPPEVELNRPVGGETFEAETEEDITWDTVEGDDPIEGIDLWYSTDEGTSWTEIEMGVVDTGDYQWIVPNEHNSDCLVRVRVTDTTGRTSEDESPGTFTIEGIPPSQPVNLEVEHHGEETATLFEDDVSEDKGYTTGISDSGSEWGIRDHGSTVGDNSWDFGDSDYFKSSSYGYLSWVISPEVEIPTEAEEVELSFEHWRDFGALQTYLDGGNLKISTSGVNGDYTLITPNEGYDGEINDGFENPLGGQQAWGGTVGWETVTFDLTEYAGEDIHLRWDVGIEAYDEDNGDGWRIDDILMTAEGIETDGDEHNLITWSPSPDDPEEVSHYNIYRSEYPSGPWSETELIDDVSADGSAQYEYLDEDKGEADDIYWWYVVRAVGENGLEEQNEESVQEPGESLSTIDIDMYTDSQADNWNFVSFNLIPEDTGLTAILNDPEHGIEGSYEKVMYYDPNDGWQSYIPGRADHFNDIDDWDHTMGLWIRMNNDDTLTIEGTEPTTTDIILNPGWNMVGLPSETAGNHGLPEEVDKIGYFDAGTDDNLAYDDEVENFEFEPSKGYWVYNPSDTTVIWTVDY